MDGPPVCWPGQAGGTLGTPATIGYSAGGWNNTLRAADLNGDDLPEIVGTDYYNHTVYVLRSRYAPAVTTFTLNSNPPVARPGGRTRPRPRPRPGRP